MRAFFRISAIVLSIGCLVGLLSGCTVVFQKGRTSDIEKIKTLRGQVKDLKMTEEQLAKLQEAYAQLQETLSKEIGEKKVSLGIEDRGLVITFVDSVLFDSGKDKLRPESHQTLDKVVSVCQGVVADREVSIEGHTDNEPIKYSGWKSNWELSTTRATSVLHYLIEKGISGERLAATGYGEYHPIATNKTVEGRQKNRRVEIVILPEKITRARPSLKKPAPAKEVQEETPQDTYVK